jgi:hypothetical protein
VIEAAVARRISFDVLRIDEQTAPETDLNETENQQLKLSVFPAKKDSTPG